MWCTSTCSTPIPVPSQYQVAEEPLVARHQRACGPDTCWGKARCTSEYIGDFQGFDVGVEVRTHGLGVRANGPYEY